MLDAAPQLVLDIGQAGGGSQPKSFVAIGNSTYFLPPITSTALNCGGPHSADAMVPTTSLRIACWHMEFGVLAEARCFSSPP